METEEQAYEVPGRQLGWRVNQLQAQHMPYNVQSLGGGVYIVIVQQPAGADPFAYQAPPSSRKSRRRTLPVNVQVSAMVLIVAAMCYVAYVMFGGSALIPSDAPDSFRAALTGVMGLTGWMLVLALAGGVFWLARPLVSAALGMARGAAGIMGRMRK